MRKQDRPSEKFYNNLEKTDHLLSAARKFGVCQKQIQDWKRARARIEEASKAFPGASNRRRLPGGRKQRFLAVNFRVRDWILEKKRLRQLVSRRLIRLEAKRIAKECPECFGFVASLGWQKECPISSQGRDRSAPFDRGRKYHTPLLVMADQTRQKIEPLPGSTFC